MPRSIMPRSRSSKVEEKDIVGLKYFNQLGPLLQRLHDDGCERDKAGNRKLHFDQYCMLLLLYLFNPTLTSLRGIQQASELKKVQKKLGCARASLGSLSEATSVFDSERLKEIIGELADQLKPLQHDRRLTDIKQTITLVDGTLLSALPLMMEAAWRKANDGKGKVKWRLHTHFEILRGVPTRIDVTRDAGGDTDERVVLARVVESDRLYVGDRGYLKFALFNQIVNAQSSYVCRLPDHLGWTVTEERYRDDDAEINEIISDQIVRFSDSSNLNHKDSRRLYSSQPAYDSWRRWWWRKQRWQRWDPADRDQLVGRSSGSYRTVVLPALGDRNLLSIFQTHSRLSASDKPRSKRYRNSDLLCDHLGRVAGC